MCHWQKPVQLHSHALAVPHQLVAALDVEIKGYYTTALRVDTKVLEVIWMGMVVMTYKINPDSEVDNVDADAIAAQISSMATEVYDVQSVEVKPLAFGLKFVQVHVTMNDGEGLADAFEGQMSEIHGVGEIEVLSMGLI